MPSIRPFEAGDAAALAEICLRTADHGADATGLLDDDELWAEVYVLPYVARHPELGLVALNDDGRVAGYLVGTDDTRAFEDWFASQWWPRQRDRWPDPVEVHSRQDELVRSASRRRAGAEPYGDAYPAHLHIDLLPELQGQGLGRRLIEEYVRMLRARGVAGVHLVASAANTGAAAFYPRVGFTPLDGPGVRHVAALSIATRDVADPGGDGLLAGVLARVCRAEAAPRRQRTCRASARGRLHAGAAAPTRVKAPANPTRTPGARGVGPGGRRVFGGAEVREHGRPRALRRE